MYAGPDCNAENNMRKVLNELKTFQNRKAKFKTVIALILNGKEYFFEGIVMGEILRKKPEPVVLVTILFLDPMVMMKHLHKCQ